MVLSHVSCDLRVGVNRTKTKGMEDLVAYCRFGAVGNQMLLVRPVMKLGNVA